MFCISLFVLLHFFFRPLCCLFFFDILILITHLASSNSSYWTWCWKIRYILSNAYRLYILWALSNTNKTNQVRWFHLRICCQQINKKQLLYAIVYLQINRWILYLYINVIKSVNTVRPQHTRVYVARGIRSVLPIKKTIFNSW